MNSCGSSCLVDGGRRRRHTSLGCNLSGIGRTNFLLDDESYGFMRAYERGYLEGNTNVSRFVVGRDNGGGRAGRCVGDGLSLDRHLRTDKNLGGYIMFRRNFWIHDNVHFVIGLACVDKRACRAESFSVEFNFSPDGSC